MSRLLLSCFGALVLGAVCWAVFGSIAAVVLSRTPGGAREGAGAMTGLFLIGPVFALVGLGLGGWITWRLLADPARSGPVSIGLFAMLALLIAGVSFALRPTIVEPNDFPGHKAEFQVEVSFPVTSGEHLSSRDRLAFELRSGDGTEVTAVDRSRSRVEGERAILPGSFSIRAAPRTKLLAVMKNDRQVMCSTLNVDGPVDDSTAWSQWQVMEEGLQARWRLIVTPK